MPLSTDASWETWFLEMPSGQQISSLLLFQVSGNYHAEVALVNRFVGKKSEETHERFIQYVHIWKEIPFPNHHDVCYTFVSFWGVYLYVYIYRHSDKLVGFFGCVLGASKWWTCAYLFAFRSMHAVMHFWTEGRGDRNLCFVHLGEFTATSWLTSLWIVIYYIGRISVGMLPFQLPEFIDSAGISWWINVF